MKPASRGERLLVSRRRAAPSDWPQPESPDVIFAAFRRLQKIDDAYRPSDVEIAAFAGTAVENVRSHQRLTTSLRCFVASPLQQR